MQNEIARLSFALAQSYDASSDFDLNPSVARSAGNGLRPAAVLVPVWQHGGRSRLILTKRASHLLHHPGQIAFPGGKVDETDGSAEEAALRESWEEIGLPPDRVQILGRLATHETVTSYSITPILGIVSGDFCPTPEPGEVDEVFSVPLSYLLDCNRYRVESRIWKGQPRNFYTVPYGPFYIWGATARILRGLAERVARCK